MVAVLKGAEPFSLQGSDVGVLVLHGFTGSTQSIRYLGEELHSRFGFTVSAPRLPGHGTSPDDMETTGYLDWMGEAERALNELAQGKRKVFVTGLSMGGTLSLNLAARHPGLVDAIAPIAAPAGHLTEAFAEALALNPPPKRIPGIGSDIKAPGVKELAYDETPMACLREVSVLISLTADLLPRIACPTLVVHAREDHLVPPTNPTAIVNAIRADDIRLLWLNNSYHVATLDNDKDLIVERVGGFFTEMARV
ncbi:alpha/beta hydrolase [Chelatococcus reniformis]|uniref:Esterase n=1 Tax=Chelatococcus reniformis TaxID=1494448 RepID=A0A916TXM0_9HYPH|nr:alpha/beta fold hydrolase [Chelatococcus reniformis]GGC47206.1 esterase [Chelatococcus reniformis]